MKIFFKIILWLCMITTVVVVTPIAIENWDEWSEIGKNFIDQLMTPDEPENDLPPDADGDGLTDEEEDRIGTNKLLADTDGDGLSDGREIFMGYDPLVPNSSFTVEKVPVVDDFETGDTVTPSINVDGGMAREKLSCSEKKSERAERKIHRGFSCGLLQNQTTKSGGLQQKQKQRNKGLADHCGILRRQVLAETSQGTGASALF